MRVRRTARALLAAAVLAAGAGCGDGEGGSSGSSTSEGAAPAMEIGRQLEDVPKDLKKKPKLPSLSGLPPMELVTKDVVTGTGAAAKAGDKVTLQYIGVTYSGDKEIDSSWEREPFEGELVSPGIIEGWVKGIAGMKAGGRRVLVIPPDLAYGDQGQPPDIPPFETLLFVIDLKQLG